MELNPPIARVTRKDTHRLIPSRFPPAGILDTIAGPDDVLAIAELEGWSNDRVSGEMGLLFTFPKNEWVTGSPGSSVVMAAFCHPNPIGARFSSPERGAWYAAMTLETALAESAFHRTEELKEIGVFDTFVDMRQYMADFKTHLHDVRACPPYEALHDPDTYEHSQAAAAVLLAAGSNGVLYRSVRKPPGECICCFRPKLVQNVRPAGHFRYTWSGQPEPVIERLTA